MPWPKCRFPNPKELHLPIEGFTQQEACCPAPREVGGIHPPIILQWALLPVYVEGYLALPLVGGPIYSLHYHCEVMPLPGRYGVRWRIHYHVVAHHHSDSIVWYPAIHSVGGVELESVPTY